MSVLERFRLDGKTALITAGAGPLFGSSCTEALAEAGATVITASRSLERNLEYAEQLRARGLSAHGMQVDLGEPESIAQLAADVRRRFGPLDVLVNNALARPAGMTSIEEVTVDALMINARADVVGLILMCKAFCPDMAARGSGSVINISSTYGLVGNDPGLYADTNLRPPVIYPFLKGGMINLTRGLAAHYGKRGVRVNSISPGGFNPDVTDEFRVRYEARCPLGRMMTHDDIQGAVVFLASPAGAYVTGANLVVDGGWTAI